MNTLLLFIYFLKVAISGSPTLGKTNWRVCSPTQTIGTRCPNVSGHNCPITEAI